MSWLSNIGKTVKKGVVDVGHAVGSVADNKWTKLAAAAALAATGVGAPMSAALLGTIGAAGGALKPGGGVKPALVGGAEGAVEGGVAGKLGSMVKAGSAEGGVSGVLGKLGGIAKTAGGGILGAAKDAVTNDQGGVDWGNLLKGGVAAAGLIGQHQQTNAANDYANKLMDVHTGQLDAAKADYASRAPIRQGAQDTIMKKLGGAGKNIFQPYLGAS